MAFGGGRATPKSQSQKKNCPWWWLDRHPQTNGLGWLLASKQGWPASNPTYIFFKKIIILILIYF
jgi:hypothetical protein